MPRLLIVDDSQDTLRVLHKLLSAIGYSVECALSAADAIIVALKHLPEVLITDCALGAGANGIELARTLRGHFPTLSVILISGYEPEYVDSQLEGFAVAGSFTKPIEISRICELLSRLLPTELNHCARADSAP